MSIRVNGVQLSSKDQEDLIEFWGRDCEGLPPRCIARIGNMLMVQDRYGNEAYFHKAFMRQLEERMEAAAADSAGDSETMLKGETVVPACPNCHSLDVVMVRKQAIIEDNPKISYQKREDGFEHWGIHFLATERRTRTLEEEPPNLHCRECGVECLLDAGGRTGRLLKEREVLKVMTEDLAGQIASLESDFEIKAKRLQDRIDTLGEQLVNGAKPTGTATVHLGEAEIASTIAVIDRYSNTVRGTLPSLVSTRGKMDAALKELEKPKG